MKNTIYIIGLVIIAFSITSCEKYQEEILPVVGVYEANVVGVSGPFSISISVDYGNNIYIDAPWDGEIWTVVDAEVRDEFDYQKRIKIFDQHLDDGTRIWGDGFFYDYTIQLDYTIRMNGVNYDYTIVGTKL